MRTPVICTQHVYQEFVIEQSLGWYQYMCVWYNARCVSVIVAAWAYAEKESTVGIECDKWVCVSKRKVGGPKITFYTWDFAGQVIC